MKIAAGEPRLEAPPLPDPHSTPTPTGFKVGESGGQTAATPRPGPQGEWKVETVAGADLLP